MTGSVQKQNSRERRSAPSPPNTTCAQSNHGPAPRGAFSCNPRPYHLFRVEKYIRHAYEVVHVTVKPDRGRREFGRLGSPRTDANEQVHKSSHGLHRPRESAAGSTSRAVMGDPRFSSSTPERVRLGIGLGSLGNLDRPRRRFRARQLRSFCVSRVATFASAIFLSVQARLSRRGGR